MNKKTNQKQYQSSITLYQRLKQVLHAEKSTAHIKPHKLISQNQLLISQSLNMNELLINHSNPKIGFSLTDDMERSSVTIEIPMTPYQDKNSSQKSINLKPSDPKKKKVPYFQVFKGKNQHILSVKVNRQKRMNNFFTTKPNTQEIKQREQNLAYSLILKTVKNETQEQKSKMGQGPVRRHGRTQSMSCQYQRFVNNQQMQKNPLSIQAKRKQMSSSGERGSKMMKNFPELQILNQNNFTQSKKNLFKRINSNNRFNSLTGHKDLIITTKNIDIKFHQCKRNTENKGCSEEDKKLHDQKRKNFQYFVYEYKTLGDQQPKPANHSTLSPSKYTHYRRTTLHSATFLRSKPSCIHRQELQSATANVPQANMFHNFIYNNKQQTTSSTIFKSNSHNRQRSMTANTKSRQPNDNSRGSGNGWKTTGIKGQVGVGVDDNFVKPWESSAEGEVGF